ncbi:hypothetical protein Taro_045904 [Colocasia esculenta]|uniref:Uncharacterized protein n=1 Tax=Colocasia esculenta TaxID=4460 RepID=A0A843X5G0_COLES|nr:hypothetical protein [Colocasia esculenta]
MLICLDNIDEIGRYNWAGVVIEMTLHKFDDFVTVVREKRSGRNTTLKRRIAGREHGSAYIFCCYAALAVWFLEHTRLRQPIDREAIPHLFRWGSILDKKLSFSIDSLQGQRIIKHLKLATIEKKAITGVRQEKIHVQTEGVAAPPLLWDFFKVLGMKSSYFLNDFSNLSRLMKPILKHQQLL